MKTSLIETGMSTPPAARFDSPLSLWIAIGQQQLVNQAV